MRMQKVYGKSKTDKCPFCGKIAITENKQGVAVCLDHKNKFLDLKCACGESLDIKKGKFGAFCTCINCGAINLNKALSVNPQIIKKETKASTKKTNSDKGVVVTSDEVDFLY